MVKSGIQTEEEPPNNKVGTQPYQRRYRWVMLALVWLSYSVFGVIIRSIAPLVSPILKDLNISYSQMGIILGSWSLSYVVFATMAGAIMDRWGVRKSIFVGIIIMGLSATLRYFANGFVTMLLFVALFGIGSPMISIGCPKVASMWFRGRERGTAVGTYMTGPVIGGLVALSTANSIVMPLTGYSWRLAFVCFGMLTFAVALLWWFLSRDVEAKEATERASVIQVFINFIRIRNVRVILIMALLAFTVGDGVNNWLPQILETGGLSPTVAGFAASIPPLVGIPTLLVLPRLVAPRTRGRVLSLLALVSAIVLLVVVTGSGGFLITGLILHGLLRHLITSLVILTLIDLPEVGPKYMGSVAGMYFCITGMGAFVGPLIIGVIKDMSGSFLMGAGFFCAGLSLVLSVMPFFLKDKPAFHTVTSS